MFYLGVFSYVSESRYVINVEENICWEFTRWNSANPNWLLDWWNAVSEVKKLNQEFLNIQECNTWNTERCCKTLLYRYAWIPIGIETISPERRAAEFIASKSIIEQQSLYPSQYNLERQITRKEVMKIIMNSSEVSIQKDCKWKFIDVVTDWWCKYIETALDNDFITENKQFRPDWYITKPEALKLIFKSRNIDKSYESESWQDDYISTALYLGYIDTKFSNYNNTAMRWWIFSVLAKTYPDFKNY